MLRFLVVSVAGIALWGEGWGVVAGSETMSGPMDVAQTADGKLWWAAGAQVYQHDGRGFRAYGVPHGLVSRGAIVLAAEPGGTLLARTTEGVFRLEGERFRKIWSGGMGLMAAGPGGLMALGTFEGRMVLGTGGNWNELDHNFGLIGQVYFDLDGTLRFGCGTAICEFEKEQLAGWERLTVKDLRRVDPQVLPEPGMTILGVAKDRWGRVWLRDWQRLFVGESLQGPYREIPVKSAGGTNLPVLRLSPGGVMYFNGPDGFVWGNGEGGIGKGARE